MIKVLIFAVVAAALVALFVWSPIEAEDVLAGAQALRGNLAAPLVVPILFVALSSMFVPLFVLRATIVLAFGPVLGPIYAVLAVALGALVGHVLGHRIGPASLERLGGERVRRVFARLQRCGMWSIAAARLLPLGPNMLVNAAAGAARVPRRSFVAGTVLGLMPGLVMLVAVGAPLEALIR